MTLRLLIACAALAAIIAAYAWGRADGRALADAAHAATLHRAQTEMVQAAEIASRKEADRLAAQATADDLARRLEDMAHADPSGGDCLPVSRVLRLNQR